MATNTKIDRKEVDKKDFVVVKDKRTLDVTKVIAPHELQIGIDGYKRASLRIEGDEFITGQLVVENGCKGVLKLLDGSSAIKAGTGTTVTMGSDGSATVAIDPTYISTQRTGVTVASGGGLTSTTLQDGLLSLSISPSYLPSKIQAGSGVSISNNNGQLTISSTTPTVKAGIGLNSSLSNGSQTLNLNVVAGPGIQLNTNQSGQIQISANANADLTGLAQLSGATFTGAIVATSGLSGSLTTLADGSTPYLTGGAGVLVSTGSNGQVQVALTNQARSGTVTDLVLNAGLSGVCDGVNKVFTLPHNSIDPGTLMLWLNGQLLTLGSDFTLAGDVVTFIGDFAPVQTDVMRAMYSRQVTTRQFALSVEPTQLLAMGEELTGLSLPQDPDPPDSLMLFLNGQLLTQGTTHDYSLSGNEVTFARPLLISDVVRATYSYVV